MMERAPAARAASWKSIIDLPGESPPPMSASLWWYQSIPALEALFSQLYPVRRLPPERKKVTPSFAPASPVLLP
jgi:hypothetical protein